MWIIRGYDREGDTLVIELPLNETDPSILRSIWALPDGDPLYDAYPVTQRIAKELSDRLDMRLEDGRLQYFLEYDR